MGRSTFSHCQLFLPCFVQRHAVTRPPRNFVPERESWLFSRLSRENHIQRFFQCHLFDVLCILPEPRSSMKKTQRIGREALRGSSGLYAPNPDYSIKTIAYLHAPCFHWPLCIHGGPVYFLELSESTTRPECHYPIPPFPDIPTASWIPKFYYNYRQSIRQCQFLQTARFCRVRERCLDCQPRAESDVRTHGYPFTTMGSPVPSTYSTELSTPRPRTHQRVLCARRGQVPRLDVRRSAACPPPHFHPPILFRTRRICIPR